MTNGSEQPSSRTLDFDGAVADIPDIIGTDTAGTPTGVLMLPVQSSITTETLGQFLALPFDLYASSIKEGGEFWPLNEQERNTLGSVWHPILAPLLARHPELDLMWVSALLMTSSILTPRLARDAVRRRASLTESTETVKSGDSSSLPDPPDVASLLRPTV